MAEWLRRWTRNPLGSARAGSNPADYDIFAFLFLLKVFIITVSYLFTFVGNKMLLKRNFTFYSIAHVTVYPGLNSYFTSSCHQKYDVLGPIVLTCRIST